MRAKKVDSNQKDLVKQIRKIPGVTVFVTSAVGNGYPDLNIGFKGKSYLLEVKDPSKPPSARKLTPDEQEFHRTWQGHAAVVETIDDVLKELNINQ